MNDNTKIIEISGINKYLEQNQIKKNSGMSDLYVIQDQGLMPHFKDCYNDLKKACDGDMNLSVDYFKRNYTKRLLHEIENYSNYSRYVEKLDDAGKFMPRFDKNFYNEPKPSNYKDFIDFYSQIDDSKLGNIKFTASILKDINEERDINTIYKNLNNKIATYKDSQKNQAAKDFERDAIYIQKEGRVSKIQLQDIDNKLADLSNEQRDFIKEACHQGSIGNAAITMQREYWKEKDREASAAKSTLLKVKLDKDSSTGLDKVNLVSHIQIQAVSTSPEDVDDIYKAVSEISTIIDISDLKGGTYIPGATSNAISSSILHKPIINDYKINSKDPCIKNIDGKSNVILEENIDLNEKLYYIRQSSMKLRNDDLVSKAFYNENQSVDEVYNNQVIESISKDFNDVFKKQKISKEDRKFLKDSILENTQIMYQNLNKNQQESIKKDAKNLVDEMASESNKLSFYQNIKHKVKNFVDNIFRKHKAQIITKSVGVSLKEKMNIHKEVKDNSKTFLGKLKQKSHRSL